MSDAFAGLILWRLADVSIRWGLVIVALAAWFAIRPPRRAATRHTLCLAALLAGPALLLAPRWDAYVYDLPPKPAPVPAPDFAPMRPLAPDEVRAIETPRVPESRGHAQPPPSTPIATPPAPIDRPRLAAKAAIAAWLAGTLLMLARLTLGVRALRRWARRATPATVDDLALLDACRALMPTSRPVRLMRHPGIASPAMVGGRRPIVMVPTDWDAWPADRRRAAMLHELAHVRRYDDASKLLEELLRVPAWFHPGVAWLLARIDRERELLCDEAAVATGDDPKGLARLLLDLSRAPSPRCLPSASLPFLTRRTTAVRIRRLLEDDMPRTLSRPSLARTLLLGPAALAALLALGTFRIREASAQDAPAAVAEKPTSPPVGSAEMVDFNAFVVTNLDDAERFEGRVVDAQGRPIAGATVLVGGPLGLGVRPVAFVSDEQGVFAGTGKAEGLKFAASVFAWKEGYAPVIGSVVPDRVSDGRFTLTLPAASPFAGVLVDENDRPIAGATLRATTAARPGPNSSVHFDHYLREDVEGTAIGSALTTTTAGDGSFLLPSARAQGSGLLLAIIGPDGRHRVVPRQAPPEEFSMGGLGFLSAKPGERPRFATIPAARIEGRVFPKSGSVDPSKFHASFYLVENLRGPISSRGYGLGAQTDADGRFVLEGLEPGEAVLHLSSVPTPKAMSLRLNRGLRLEPGGTATVAIDMDEGVEVSGVVLSEATGAPLAGAEVQVDGFDGPERRLLTAFERRETDAEGRYRVRLPAHTVVAFVTDAPSGYTRPSATIQVPEGATTLEAPPLKAGKSAKVRGRVVDAEGRPIAHADVAAVAREEPHAIISIFGGSTTDQGEFGLEVDPERFKIGAAAMFSVRAGDGVYRRFDAEPDAAGLYVVKFSTDPGGEKGAAAAPPAPVGQRPVPSAELYGSVNLQISSVKNADPAERFEGRVVDAEGRPIAGATVLVGGPLGSDARPVAVVSDERGVFARGGELKLGSPVLAWKEGYAPAAGLGGPDRKSDGRFTLVLPRASAFAGILVDESDRPIAGASLRVAAVARPGAHSSVGFESYRREDVEGTPIAAALTTSTADDGSFLLPSAWAEGTGIYLAIVGPDGRHRVIPRPAPAPQRPSMEANGFLAPKPGERPRLASIPAARIEGRIVSKAANFNPPKFHASVHSATSLGYRVGIWTDDEGRFVFDGLQPGETLISVSGLSPIGIGVEFYRRVKLAAGLSTTILFDMDEGVEVSGVVRSGASGKPVAGAQLQVDGPRWGDDVPTVATASPTTDAEGRYRAWVLPGAAEVKVVDAPPGNLFRSLAFEIPKGATTFDAPPLELGAAMTIRGRLVAPADILSGGFHVSVPQEYVPPPAQLSRGAFVNERGEFAFDVDPARYKVGKPMKLMIMPLGGGPPRAIEPREIEAAPDADGVYVVKLDEPSAKVIDAPDGVLQSFVRVAEPADAPIDGTVVDPDGKPIVGATVVVDGEGDFGRRSLTTDDAGRFSTPGTRGEGMAHVSVVKPGFAPASAFRFQDPGRQTQAQRPLVLKLLPPAPFAGVLVDEADRPIAGATVRVIRTGFNSDLDGDGTRISSIMFQFPHARTAGTPIEKALLATTAEDGSFTLPEAAPAWAGLRFEIRTADGRPRIVPHPRWDRGNRSMDVIAGPEGQSQQVKTYPAARIEGRVVSKVAGVDVSRLRAWLQGSRPRPRAWPQESRPNTNAPTHMLDLWGDASVDAEGLFAFDGLEFGTVNVFVQGEGEAESWTYRSVKDLKLEPGRTSAATIELIEGVEVTGLVKAEKGDRPVAGAEVAVYGPFRPKTGAATTTHPTDAEGRYRFRLPAGETDLSIFSLPEGYLPVNQRPEGHRTVTIPEGGRFEVPPLVAVANQGPAAAVKKAAPGR